MKTLICLISIVTLTASADAQVRTKADYNAASRAQAQAYQRQSEINARKRAADIAAANRLHEWQRLNPWWNDSQWIACTNKLGQVNKIIAANTTELRLLTAANLGQSERGQELAGWIKKAQTTRQDLEKTRRDIEASWRLKMYYLQNKPLTTNGPVSLKADR
jgi:hypothetical protein